MLVDTHCHLDMLEDLDAVLERMRAAGVERAVTIGVASAASRNALAFLNVTVPENESVAPNSTARRA